LWEGLNSTLKSLLFSHFFLSASPLCRLSLSLSPLFLATPHIIWKYKKYLAIFYTNQTLKNIFKIIFRVANKQPKIVIFNWKLFFEIEERLYNLNSIHQEWNIKWVGSIVGSKFNPQNKANLLIRPGNPVMVLLHCIT
jgi:hypothetical protein